jgi:hypothetical protein
MGAGEYMVITSDHPLPASMALLSAQMIHLPLASDQPLPFQQPVSAGPQRQQQRAYTEAAHAQLQSTVDELAAAKGRAAVVRTEAARGYGATAYLRMLPGEGRPRRLPYNRDHRGGLPSSYWRITLARHLQLPLATRHAGRLCPLCKAGTVDADGDHAEACAYLHPRLTEGHNHGRDAVFLIAQEANMRPELEVPGLVPGNALRRPGDVCIKPYTRHGLIAGGGAGLHALGDAGALIDCVHTQLLAASHINQPLGKPLRDAHAAKARRAPPPGYLMYPLAWDSCGSWHEPSLRPMLSFWAAQLMAEREEEEDEEHSIRSATRLIELRWLPRLSAAAHWGTARGLRQLLAALERSDDDGQGGVAAADGRDGDVDGGSGGTGASHPTHSWRAYALQRSDLVGLPSVTRALIEGAP